METQEVVVEDVTQDVKMGFCAECGTPAPLEDFDTEFVLCEDCAAAVADQPFRLTSAGERAVTSRRDWLLYPLHQLLPFSYAAVKQSMDQLSEQRNVVEQRSAGTHPHHPRLIIAASEALYWAVHAVRGGHLAQSDAESLLRDLGILTHLLPDELVTCAAFVYRLRDGSNKAIWPVVERATVGAWIESYIYRAKESQLRSVNNRVWFIAAEAARPERRMVVGGSDGDNSS